MTQYFKKSALVVGIEKKKKSLPWGSCASQISMECNCKNEAYDDVISILNTIEVKEVDLDIQTFAKEMDSVFALPSSETKNTEEEPLNLEYAIAKHFFELGLQARTDKELVEEVYSHIDSIKDTADRMTSGNFMHNRAAIKFSANTIAKVLELIGLKAQKGE